MSGLVYPLEDAPSDPALVGGKAAGLTGLVRAGLPVPPGFVLTAEAFRAFLRANGLEQELGVLAIEEGADEGVLSRLHSARWPDELRSAVEAAYAALCERSGGGSTELAEAWAEPAEASPVAVRSSATAEDSAGASFAGQHLTLLNIEGLEAVLDGVLACWASLYGPTAVHYRRTR